MDSAAIAMPASLIPRVFARLRGLASGPYQNMRTMMHAPWLSRAVLYSRYVYYVHMRRQLRVLDGVADVSKSTVAHNLPQVRASLFDERPLSLVRPLSVLETLGPKWDVRVLSLGPRSEGELFRLWTHGYRWRNIRGLDLISYSPSIDLGDMHNMPYADSSFDLVVCGWTLAYSDNQRKAAKEITRVVRPGGIVAISAHYLEKTNEEIVKELGYLSGSTTRIFSVEQMLSYFEDNVDHVYFNHGIVKGVNTPSGALMAIFSIKK